MIHATPGTRIVGLSCYGFGLLSVSLIAHVDSAIGVSLLIANGLVLIVIGIREVCRS